MTELKIIDPSATYLRLTNLYIGDFFKLPEADGLYIKVDDSTKQGNSFSFKDKLKVTLDREQTVIVYKFATLEVKL